MKRHAPLRILVICAILALVSCTKEKGINSNTKVFNLAKFKQNLISQISLSAATQPMGYAFVINQNGVLADSFATGNAATDPAGGGSIGMSTKTQINIASVTKVFTGIAAQQLIKAKGLSLSTKIGPYLPVYWNAATAVRNITFEELLTHGSGLTQSNTSWDSMRVTCNRGLDNPGKPADVYANINFALFRAMIPYMDDPSGAASQESAMLPGNPDGFESWLSQQYLDYMQDNVFTPAGISNAQCLPNPSRTNIQAFSESNSVPAVINSATPGDWTQLCGGGGYYLTCFQMAQMMAYIAQTTTLLDQAQKNAMDAKYMGWDNEDSPMTYAGRAYGKDGALWWDSNSSGGQNTGDAGLQTFVIKFPNNVELSLLINSIPGNYRNIVNFVRIAYDNAWE